MADLRIRTLISRWGELPYPAAFGQQMDLERRGIHRTWTGEFRNLEEFLEKLAYRLHGTIRELPRDDARRALGMLSRRMNTCKRLGYQALMPELRRLWSRGWGYVLDLIRNSNAARAKLASEHNVIPMDRRGTSPGLMPNDGWAGKGSGSAPLSRLTG